jgi:molybdopterin converting factor small subunit
MPVIIFNAFSFLQKKLENENIEFSDVQMTIAPDTSATQLVSLVKLSPRDVEAVFINGKVAPFDTVLKDGDRVALVPPGTPGPYRVFLGFKNLENQSKLS